MKRSLDRARDCLREIRITRHYLPNTYGSCLISFGKTMVLCTAKSQDKVPDFLVGSKKGWLTAEYAMIPGATVDRKARERLNKVDSRSLEIQRLIGRCIRSVCDLKAVGERTIWMDCEVLNADGGTRTAAITGAFVALSDCLAELKKSGVKFPSEPIREFAAACSVGIVESEILLDLDYEEDSRAEIDMNVCATESGRLVEVQASSEAGPVARERFDEMLNLALEGVKQLTEIQRRALSGDSTESCPQTGIHSSA